MYVCGVWCGRVETTEDPICCPFMLFFGHEVDALLVRGLPSVSFCCISPSHRRP